MATFLGIVLRAGEKKETAEFYKKLGLETNEHQHGGPKHFEAGPVSSAFVVEIYQQSENFPEDAIMLEVDSLFKALGIAREYGISPHRDPKETKDFMFAYIKDPDGRDIMLVQKRTKTS